MHLDFVKSVASPVLGEPWGTCFDMAVLPGPTGDRMWFSWRNRQAIALTDSTEGERWSEPRVVLAPPARWVRGIARRLGWPCDDLTRPSVIQVGSLYQMWYAAHGPDQVNIGYAHSTDGLRWRRRLRPVLVPEQPWEKAALMCPCVIHDPKRRVYRMWYSGGNAFEPDATGYAESADGLHWSKHPRNPVFAADPANAWERDRAVGMQVVPVDGGYVAFYIGFANGFEQSAIGLARSRDGITGWERFDGNPIVRPGPAGAWDDGNVYKPFAVERGGKWRLWYNASRLSDRVEQIGLATCDDLRFASFDVPGCASTPHVL